MIIGSGDIASILEDRDGALFFASGVSNSDCKDQLEFKRERDLLLAQDNKLCCFYFGSISAPLISNDYFRHKFKMEMLVKTNFNNYNIIRLGNIDWGSNPHTFRNFIRNRIGLGLPYEIKDEYRYMIDKDTLQAMTSNLPLVGQNIVNVFSRKAKVKDLI